MRIGTDVTSHWPANSEWADVGDRLTHTSAAQLQSYVTAADRDSEHLAVLLAAVARVRDATSPDEVLARAPQELCKTPVFDRVLLSRVRGSRWLPQEAYWTARGGDVRRCGRAELQQRVAELDIALASPLVEAEVVRRRLPALVQEARDEPRAWRPFIELSGSREYVVAPIVIGSSVIALMHADTRTSMRALSSLDRDLIRLFADAVALSYENAELTGRMECVRGQIGQAAQSALDAMQLPEPTPRLANRSAAVVHGACADVLSIADRVGENRDSSRLGRLTGREREVLALLASGATNAQLADQLTVAESTVKSHVKHILHKLGAGNRAAAIACYLRETQTRERSLR